MATIDAEAQLSNGTATDANRNGTAADAHANQTRTIVHDSGSEEKKQLSPWGRFSAYVFRMEMLLAWTVVGVVCGVALGAGLYTVELSSTWKNLIGYPGEIMIRAFQEVILPLMVFALMSGVFSLRSTKTGSGKITAWALGYYLLSMILAIAAGILFIYTIKPGRSRPFDNVGGECSSGNDKAIAAANESAVVTSSAVDSILNLGRDLIPKNLVAAAALPNYLGIMVFAITFAVFLLKMGDKAEPIIEMVEVCNFVIIKLIHLIILMTPLGITSWIASTILQACDILGLLESLGLFIITICAGLALHFFILLPLTLVVLSQQNPIKAAKTWMPALTMAIGTSSSAATMPVSMQCGLNFGCTPGIVNFVLPLGTNVNRDGTALYEAAAVIFICQAHGEELNLGEVIVIVLVATLAAIGTASIPFGGLVTLITAMQATGNAQYLGDLAVLYSVDWFLGMLRTAVNVWGDACATVVVDTWLRKYGKDVEMPNPTYQFSTKDQELSQTTHDQIKRS